MKLARNMAAASLIAATAALAQPPARTDRPADRPVGQPADRTITRDRDTGRDMATKAMTLVPSEWVQGAKVMSSSTRDKIGTVKNLVLSSIDGRIEYAIVSTGGVLGVGDRLVAIPWDSFIYESKDRVLAIGYTADQLKNAPEFKDDQWPMIGEKTWRQKVGDFFGTSKVGKADATDNDQSWSQNGRYQTLVGTGRRSTARGVVKDIDNKSPGNDLGEGCIVTITDDTGKDRVVHLGPSWFVKHQQTILKTGDNVEVQGTEFTLDGRDVIAVRSISTPQGTFAFRDDQGRPAWDASTGGAAAAGRPNETVPGGVHAMPEARTGGAYLKGSDLKGQNLKTGADESAGEIKDFVFDVNTGHMGFLVVGFGGFLGIGDERVAVPWELFTVNKDGKLVLTDISKDQLKAAPRIKASGDWTDLSDITLTDRVYKHFGRQRPMHETYRPPAPGTPPTGAPRR